MSDNQYKPRNFRIISHTTRNRILHIEDALAIRQVRFDLWAFARGRGSKGQAEAYVDVDEARLLFTDLAAGILPERFQSIGGSQRDGQAMARVITVEEVKANNPIKITIQNGKGIPQDNGLITPAWWGDKKAKPDVDLAVLLDRRTARKIALAALAHLRAWAAATYYQRVTLPTNKSGGFCRLTCRWATYQRQPLAPCPGDYAFLRHFPRRAIRSLVHSPDRMVDDT